LRRGLALARLQRFAEALAALKIARAKSPAGAAAHEIDAHMADVQVQLDLATHDATAVANASNVHTPERSLLAANVAVLLCADASEQGIRQAAQALAAATHEADLAAVQLQFRTEGGLRIIECPHLHALEPALAAMVLSVVLEMARGNDLSAKALAQRAAQGAPLVRRVLSSLPHCTVALDFLKELAESAYAAKQVGDLTCASFHFWLTGFFRGD
jgi:hypothetical protein